MKRRTFARKTGAVGIGVLLTPILSLKAQAVSSQVAALPRAMQTHLHQLERDMLQGQISGDQAGMIRSYLEPARILEVEQKGDDYSLKFQNRQAHILTLTRKKGKVRNRIAM